MRMRPKMTARRSWSARARLLWPMDRAPLGRRGAEAGTTSKCAASRKRPPAVSGRICAGPSGTNSRVLSAGEGSRTRISSGQDSSARTATADSPFHDRFRGRLMFPYLRGSPRSLGFGARLLTAAGDGAQHPKYLNSPETPLFKKGQLLFGLSESRAAIRSLAGGARGGYFEHWRLLRRDCARVVAAGGTGRDTAPVVLLQRSGAEELIVLLRHRCRGLEARPGIGQTLLAAASRPHRAASRCPTDPTPSCVPRMRGLQGVLDKAVPLTNGSSSAIAGRVAERGPRPSRSSKSSSS